MDRYSLAIQNFAQSIQLAMDMVTQIHPIDCNPKNYYS
jgi:hypothetical protein